MKLPRKTAILFLTAIFSIALPVAMHAKGGGGGMHKSYNTSAGKKNNENAKPSKPKTADKVDINTAPAAQLATLPGITADLADKIIAGRPYKSLDDLKGKNILSSSQYNAIKDLVVAKQPKQTAQ